MTGLRHHSPAARIAAIAVLTLLGARPAAAVDETSWIDDLGIRAGTPLLMLPAAAGAVIGIDERRKIDSYTQIITLRGDGGTVGENNITVTVTRDGLAPRIDEEALSSDMERSLPAGLAMVPGALGTRNALGIFGAAWGSQGGLTCLYGWQSVNLADRWITGRSSSLFNEQHALSIRVRLCRTSVAAPALTAMVQGLQSVVGGGAAMMTPVRGGLYGDALSAASGVETWDGPLGQAPVTGYDPGMVQPVAEMAAPHSPVRRQRHRIARETHPLAREESSPPPRTPMAGMPIVPLPQ